MSLAYLFNSCWMAACYREARAYERDANDVLRAQAKVLASIVRRSRDTWFGRQHGFASIRNWRDYQKAVPISTYDDYRAAIERIAGGEQNVLSSDSVRLLEPTGGSTSGEKLIPFTSPLQRSFHRAIRLWIWDLYSQRPAVRRGRVYWSITPPVRVDRRTTGGIPIGFESDSQYLSRWEKYLVQKTTILPPEVVSAPSIAMAQYATLFHLLRARDLSLISVWSPTFLTVLFQVLSANWEALVHDVANGRITFEARGSFPLAGRQYRPLASRADELRSIFRNASNPAYCAREVWPLLAMVSCWADGPSLVHTNSLRNYLGGVEIQPKGLLATEAFVSVPRLACAAAALAIRSHFFEFLPASATADTDEPQPLLARELAVGEHYRVVVTTDGGLYRYQLHDEIEVVGFHRDVPLMRFVGKIDAISDLVGEKLHAAHVQAVLQRAYLQFSLWPTFSQLRPQQLAPPGYVLQLVASGIEHDSLLVTRLRETIECGLDANPGYRYARAMGQLQPLQIEVLDQRAADKIMEGGIAASVAAGHRLGDIKPMTLQP
jgi:hypothetical protein